MGQKKEEKKIHAKAPTIIEVVTVEDWDPDEPVKIGKDWGIVPKPVEFKEQELGEELDEDTFFNFDKDVLSQ